MYRPGLIATTLIFTSSISAACHKSSNSPAPVPDLVCDGGAADWPQWALAGAHNGTTCATGQPLSADLFSAVVDENVAQEKVESFGELLVHYQEPIVIGDDVYMEHKAGQYTACSPPGSGSPGCGPQSWNWQIWSERAYAWGADGKLAQQWEFVSDWVPPPNGPQLSGWEPVFHAAVANDMLYVPGAHGSVARVDRTTGKVIDAITPFELSSVYTVSPIVADASGNAFYTVLVLDENDPWETQGVSANTEGFLIRLAPNGTLKTISFTGLIPGAPAASASCQSTFGGATPRPFPPPDVNGQAAKPPQMVCGTQRPGINAAPAIGADGSVYVVSRAHRALHDNYLVALNPDLTLKWATSFKNLLNDGCGVLDPMDGTDQHCSATARVGVDPLTNDPPTPIVYDDSTASPVVLPDGSVIYGGLTFYNQFRGHLLKFDTSGKFTASYDFGWDITPAVFAHNGTYSIVLKDNRYETGPYTITQLDANLKVQWMFDSFETNSCTRQPSGSVTCTNNHPGGFEWCVNSVAIDKSGVVYANSEDGNLYAIKPGGILRDRIFLDQAISAAYTPLAIDAKGRIYTQNNGSMIVVGGP